MLFVKNIGEFIEMGDEKNPETFAMSVTSGKAIGILRAESV